MLAFPSVTRSQGPSYAITDLGTLGGDGSIAFDINESGQVVGEATAASGWTHAFLFDGTSMQDLGTLGGFSSSARGINESGAVTGQADTSDGMRAFLFEGGSLQNLGTIFGVGNSSASDIDDNGDVVGQALTSGYFHAFLLRGTSSQDLGTLGGHSSSAARVLSGRVIGRADLPSSTSSHAFLWQSGSMQDLGTLGGQSSVASDINDAGDIVGQASTAAERHHAFLHSGGTMQDLGTLPGHNASAASGINNHGDIDGGSGVQHSGESAVLWSGGAIVDLNTLIPAGSGGTLEIAEAINDAGQIVGIGTNPSGDRHAFLLTPGPPGGGGKIAQTFGLGASGSFAVNPSAYVAEPVNTLTGSYFTSATDLALPGVGVPFRLTRSYNSADATGGPLGSGWTHSLAVSLEVEAGGDVTARAGDGQQLAFARQADGSFLAAAGGRATLSAIPGGYELVTRDQLRYRFDASGRLTSVSDRNGRGLTLAYDGGCTRTAC